ncbi:hypothetical protein N9M15_00110 [Bacteroidia bacterium]|nr:hypothetical protein [Bacteroidia bacterium]
MLKEKILINSSATILLFTLFSLIPFSLNSQSLAEVKKDNSEVIRYSDFNEAMSDYKKGKIGVEKFPEGPGNFEWTMYKDRIVKDFCIQLNKDVEKNINGRYGGYQGIVFNYDMTIRKQGDHLVSETSFTGPAHSVKKTINGVDYEIIRDLKNYYDAIPDSLYRDSLYLGKIRIGTMIGNELYIPTCERNQDKIADFIQGVYKHKYKAGDKVELGDLTFKAKIDFGSSDTVWWFNMSQSGYPDYGDIREKYNPDSLKKASYWHNILTKADFKKNVLSVAEYIDGNVILKMPVKIKLYYMKQRKNKGEFDVDSTKIKFALDMGYNKEIKRHLFLFEKQTDPSFKSEGNWYSAVGRDIDVLYKLYIHNNMVLHETALENAEFKKKKAERQEAEKQELAKKYGRANVDAAYNFSPRVGMPEELLNVVLALWSVDRKSQTSNSYSLYCHSKLDTSSRLFISVTNGKVSSFYAY